MATLPDALSAPPLVLRRWRETDLTAVMAAIRASIVDLRMWMPWAADGVPAIESERAVLKAGSAGFDRDAEWQYSIVEVDGDELVGGCGLHRPDGEHRLEIGYWVRSDRQGRGYATAAARCLTDAAFGFLADADRVEIRMDRANVASARVPAKLGFELDGEEPRERLARGHTGRGFVWSTSRDRWSTLTS